MERLCLQRGHRLVCGVDEVGRGPLAGPVMAAAVLLPWDMATVDQVPKVLVGLNDSKKLSASKRQHFAAVIKESALAFQVGVADPREIERINIRQAALLAMSRAIHALSLGSEACILVDGRDLPDDLPCEAQAVIRGDQISLSIAAASVLAKVARDELMGRLAEYHPGYGWERNCGYPTAEHRRALQQLGVTEQHRRTFAPVRKIIEMVSS